VAAKLLPTAALGCKRICVDTGYYDTYNRPNVTLVDLRAAPIQAITPPAFAPPMRPMSWTI